MSSYNNSSNNSNNSSQNNQHQQPKNHLGYNDNDMLAKIKQIKANREARLKAQGRLPSSSSSSSDNNNQQPEKQGPKRPVVSVLGGSKDGPVLPIEKVIAMSSLSSSSSSSDSQQPQDTKKDEFNNPSTFIDSNGSDTSGSGSGKDYSYYQSQIQSQFAQFQGERINQIAKLARKDKHEILLFKENVNISNDGIDENDIPDEDRVLPENMSQEEYINSICERQIFRMKLIPNPVHIRLEELRGEIADLQRVKALATSSVSDKGIVTPPQLVKNDTSITGIDDKTFATISEVISKKQSLLLKLMAYHAFGIGKKTYARVETTSFNSAVEAAQYREQFGLVESSKNSTAYLT